MTVNLQESGIKSDPPTIQVVGIGLSGATSLTPTVLALVESATLLIGGRRHLDAFNYLLVDESCQKIGRQKIGRQKIGRQKIEAWPLGDFTQAFADLRSRLKSEPMTQAVILASGDPLFFGIGRLLLELFSADQLAFHPQISSIQLAFSRLKLPWQEATLVSVHGRDEQRLIQALKQGDQTIAVLTDRTFTPKAIAALMVSLDLPISYRLWVCENLGAANEQISDYWPEDLSEQRPAQKFAPLNVVVLCRQEEAVAQSKALPEALPLIGLPDSVFKGFRDRPTLMTKREIRLLILGAIAPVDGQTIWDIGAGTGSISVELSRLCPNARVYAIEKTAMGAALIRHNAQRLAIAPIQTIQGRAPAALANLPTPDRVFIGGSSGGLISILNFLVGSTAPPARIVLALATLEHISELTAWSKQPAICKSWSAHLTQINISRSSPVGPLTRFVPLNPITLVTLWQLAR